MEVLANGATPPHKVRIHVDQTPYESPNPTTGADLYELVHVKDGHVLFKEVQGDHEDPLVRIDAPTVHLKENAHFHSGDAPAHYYVIVINTNPVVVNHDVVTFDELVKLAFANTPTGTDPEFTVTFANAKSKPHDAQLKAGGTVTVKRHGTSFDVTHSNRS